LTDGAARLHPHLRHAIVHDLGWRTLRPVQIATIETVLDGANAVVLAPTAGGKTEAALFPVLSWILTREIPAVAALYICPIRALLNNLEGRVRGLARMVGLDAFVWHGDVSDSRRSRFRREPRHILMTTPESLEVMLISAKTDARALFANLSFVIVDEVHAFAGDDRGAHLASLLERLGRFCGRDLQRIGLSATVGNPAVIGNWLQGASERAFRLVDPPRSPAPRSIAIDLCTDMHDAALGIAQVARSHKSLVFVESRARAERVAQALSGRGVEVFIHHSSVSRADRALAEAQFAQGENTAIVCTSTMELGIDVGDLDLIVQVDSPASVASFLQRIGRTGRREGSQARCSFFCMSPEQLLQAVTIVRLAESGWVEDVVPQARAFHILAHEVMALVLQEGGISRYRILPWIRRAWPFHAIEGGELQRIVDTMLERDILYESGGTLSLGRRGEQLYGRKNFFDLYAVFDQPPVMRVQHGRNEVGYVQAFFVQANARREGPLCFRLAGRAWRVIRADLARGVLSVKPAEKGRVPTWLGQPSFLSFRLCQAIKAVLLEPRRSEERWLSASASDELRALREEYQEFLDPDGPTLEDTPEGIQWHTFAGGEINYLLSAGLEKVTGEMWVAGNLSLKARDVPMTVAREGLRRLVELDWNAVAVESAQSLVRGRLGKFAPCLPEDEKGSLLAGGLLDVAGTRKFLGIGDG